MSAFTELATNAAQEKALADVEAWADSRGVKIAGWRSHTDTNIHIGVRDAPKMLWLEHTGALFDIMFFNDQDNRARALQVSPTRSVAPKYMLDVDSLNYEGRDLYAELDAAAKRRKIALPKA